MSRPDHGVLVLRSRKEGHIPLLISGLFMVPFAYLLGGIPTAYILGRRFRRADIRVLGSRNVGTLNAFRLFGWRIALAVLTADAAKGAAVILLAQALSLPVWGIFAVAVASAVGNNWSPYLAFNGGKGVAVVLGMSLAMVPVLSLVSLPFMVLGFVITRNFVWAFAAAFMALNVLVVTSGQPASTVALCLTLSAIVVATHLARTWPDIFSALASRDVRRLGEIE